MPKISNAEWQSSISAAAVGIIPLPSRSFNPAVIRGMRLSKEDPLDFDFIIDTGNSSFDKIELEAEAYRLIKYFLSSLTIPEENIWVNLSPYERNRIISEDFGLTEMGRDLLSQDYLLKQIATSLMYPEKEVGAKFWENIYKKAYEEYGTTDIPIDTFNKVWIVPDGAVIYEKEDSAFIVRSHLKVMLEADYLAMTEERKTKDVRSKTNDNTSNISRLTSDVVKQVIIPAIEKEVNEGESFSRLRQVYNSMILAKWYKDNLKDSLLGRKYMNKSMVAGVDAEDKEFKEKIYERYLKAFKGGTYNYIKEEYDVNTKQIIPRKYFSGGIFGSNLKYEVSHDGSTMPASVKGKIVYVGDHMQFKINPLKRLSRLLKLSAAALNLDISSKASDEKLLMYIFKFLRTKGLASWSKDKDGNIILVFDKNIKRSGLGQLIQGKVIDPSSGSFRVDLVNIPFAENWIIAGFEDDLTDDVLEHERLEVYARKVMHMDWIDAHNWAIDEQLKADPDADVPDHINAEMASFLRSGGNKKGFGGSMMKAPYDLSKRVNNLVRQRKGQEAISLCEMMINKYQNDPYPVTIFIKLLLKLDRTHKAVEAGEKAVQSNFGNNAFVRNSLANAYIKDGQIIKAIKLAEETLTRHREDRSVRNILANAYILNNEPEKAVKVAKDSVEMSENLGYKDPFAYVNLVNAYIESGSADEGIPIAYKAEKLFPDNYVVHNITAKALVYAKRPKEAIPYGKKALELSRGRDISAFMILSKAYLYAGEFGLAIDIAEKSAETFYNSFEVYNNLSMIYQAAGYTEKAIETSRLAKKRFQGNTKVLVILANIYLQADMLQDAIAEAQEALMKDPMNVVALTTLANAYIRSGASNKAIMPAKKAVDISNGKDANAYVTLITALIGDKQISRAIAIGITASEIFQNNPAVFNVLTQAYQKAGKDTDAIQSVKKALDLDPSDPISLNILAAAYIQSGDLKKGIETAERARKLYPENSNILNTLATGYKKAGRIKEAVATAEKAYGISPKDVVKINTLSLSYLKNNQAEKAAHLIEKARSIEPDGHRTLIVAALIYLALGRLNESITIAEKLCMLTPEDGDSFMILAKAYLKDNKYEKAISVLEHARKIEPNNIALLTMLGNIFILSGEIEKGFAVSEELRYLAPKDPYVITLSANAYMKKDMVPNAVEVLERARTNLQENPYISTSLINAYLKLNQNDKALNLCKQLEKLYAQDPVFLSSFANTYIRLGRYDDAVRVALYAQYLSPKDPYVLNTLAKAYLESGKFTMVLEVLNFIENRELLDNSCSHVLLARANIGLNNIEQAVKILKSAEILLPNDIELKGKLNSILTRIKEGNAYEIKNEAQELSERLSDDFMATQSLSVSEEKIINNAVSDEIFVKKKARDAKYFDYENFEKKKRRVRIKNDPKVKNNKQKERFEDVETSVYKEKKSIKKKKKKVKGRSNKDLYEAHMQGDSTALFKLEKRAKSSNKEAVHYLDQIKKLSKDNAQVSRNELDPGGIDFNLGLLDIEIKGEGFEFDVPSALNELNGIQIDGVSPFIYSIEYIPAGNLYDLLK